MLNKKNRLHVALVLVLLLGATLAAAGVAQAADINVTISPSPARPGDLVAISGQVPGGAGEATGITVREPGGNVHYVDQVTSDSEGAFDTSFRLPVGAALGVWQVQVAGAGTSGRATFTVQATPGPGDGGGGSGAPVPSGPDVPPGAAVPVNDSAVNAAIEQATTTGQVVLQAAAGRAEIALTLIQLDKIAASGQPVGLEVAGVQFTLPPAAVATLAGVEGAQLDIAAEPLAAAEAQQLAAQATNAARFRLAGNVYELNIVAVQANGDRVGITDLGGAIQVRLPVPAAQQEAAAARTLTAGWYNEATNAWEELVSGYDAATQTMAFEVTHLSKYALLEKVAAARQTFADIQGHWAQDDIEIMAGLGIARGIGADKFNPDGQVTRAEFAALLVRSLGLEETAPERGHFTDVGAGSWYYGAVETAYASGLVSGYGGGVFRPEARITREEMAAMVTRALAKAGGQVELDDVEGVLASFADANAISSWAREEVATALAAEIIQGRGGNLFAPQANATRAEAVVMLHRMLTSLGRLP